MSDKPHNKAKSTDRVENKALDKPSTNPEVAKESQTDAKGQQEIELKRTNKHDGSAGKSDQGDIESVRIESIDEHGNKKTVSRKDGGAEQDLLPADRSTDRPSDRPVGGFDEVHRADGGITLKGVIPGPGEELANITTGTMEALAPENALVKNALEMRRQLDQHMEPGAEKDKLVRQLKADVAASLMSSDSCESELAGTHEAITDNNSDKSLEMPEKAEQDWQSVVEKVSQLPIDKQFEIIGAGLQSFNNEIERQKLEIATGTVEGIGEGFKSIGEGVTSLANRLGQISQFSVDVMTNNPRALETGAKAGEAIGKTLVGGVRLFQLSNDYLYDIGFTGDYSKPFRDISNLGQELDRRWKELTPREQARLAAKLTTENLGSFAIPFGASKIAKSNRITTALEDFALASKQAGSKASEKVVDSIASVIDDLTDFVSPTEELVPAGGPPIRRKRLTEWIDEQRDSKSSNVMLSQADDVGKNISSDKGRSIGDGSDKVAHEPFGSNPFDKYGERIDPEKIGMSDRLYTLNSWLRVRGNNSFYNMEYIRSNGKTHNTYRDTVQKVAELAKEYGAKNWKSELKV